jgi:hypothetical protein
LFITYNYIEERKNQGVTKMKTLTQVKKIGKSLTGIEITATIDRRTMFQAQGTREKTLYARINVNKRQINNIRYQLVDRGYDTINDNIMYLQSLLHEIAHYKQWKKAGNCADYNNEYYKNPRYYERVADRYALRFWKVVARRFNYDV